MRPHLGSIFRICSNRPDRRPAIPRPPRRCLPKAGPEGRSCPAAGVRDVDLDAPSPTPPRSFARIVTQVESPAPRSRPEPSLVRLPTALDPPWGQNRERQRLGTTCPGEFCALPTAPAASREEPSRQGSRSSHRVERNLGCEKHRLNSKRETESGQHKTYDHEMSRPVMIPPGGHGPLCHAARQANRHPAKDKIAGKCEPAPRLTPGVWKEDKQGLRYTQREEFGRAPDNVKPGVHRPTRIKGMVWDDQQGRNQQTAERKRHQEPFRKRHHVSVHFTLHQTRRQTLPGSNCPEVLRNGNGTRLLELFYQIYPVVAVFMRGLRELGVWNSAPICQTRAPRRSPALALRFSDPVSRSVTFPPADPPAG
jgi:hypothetical protein